MKNILIVWDGNYPWDVRVDKECQSLLDAGHSVNIVARNTKQKERLESFRGATIHRLPRFPKQFPAINKILSFPFFLHPVWLWNIYKVAKSTECNIIIVRDLPLAISGIIIGKLLGLPMILDMAECYPELLRASNEGKGFSIINSLVRNPRFAEHVESYSTRRADHIFVMAEEARQYLVEKGVNKNKTTIVSNTPVLKKFNASNTVKKNSSEVKIIYVGLVSEFRGLHHVIAAMEKLVHEYPELRLQIVGSGSYLTVLEQLVKDMNLSEYVELSGWVDNDKVPQLINESDIGVVAHKKCAHSDTTVPNKIFDYMAMGKPVIVSNARPLERIVTTENCGIAYEDGNINALADSIKTLMNTKIRTELGQNGERAVKEKYNWDVDQLRFISAIEKTISSR